MDLITNWLWFTPICQNWPVDGKVKWCVEDMQESHGREDTDIPDLEVSYVGVVTFELGSDCDCFVDAEVV